MAADDPLPLERPRRRTFIAAYKLTILAELDGCVGDGDKGAVLRREGLYSSHIVEWRRAREAGALTDAGAPASRRVAVKSTDAVALARALRRAERAEAELAKTRLVLEIQGKASELLERLLAESNDPKQPR